jgi:2-amino-4-hydroxy-6-hydroxymethyldihydropteridine diphosphokinase
MHFVSLSLGANLPSPAGPPDATLAAALGRLASLGQMTARSSLYSTAPVGYIDQPRFLNAALSLDTSLSPLELLGALLTIERDFGRDRLNAIPDGPRTLDLDLVLYGDFVLNQAALEIPHPRFASRAFVLVPLNEIAPQLRDPRSGRTVAELLDTLRQASEPLDTSVVPIASPHWPAAAS